MNPASLSFAGSPITTVPPEAVESPVLECVILSYTNVQERFCVVQYPSLYSTCCCSVEPKSRPFVVDGAVRGVLVSFHSGFFNAHGSRFCVERDAIVTGDRTGFSITTTAPGAHDLASVMDVSTPAKLEFAQAAMTCDPGLPFFFPLDLQDMTSAIPA